MKKLFIFVSCMAVALFVATSSQALDFDFSGSFQQDNDVLFLDFSVDQDSTITIFSSSWDDGGFDPILAIWDNGGNIVNEQDDGGNTGSTLSNGVSYDHGVWDSFFDVFLTAGTYTASITQYNNFRVGDTLSDGFIHDGNPNFTFDLGFGGATQPFFNGVWDVLDPRTGDWAFHILNVEEAFQVGLGPDVVPEPSTVFLLTAGLIGLAALGRKRVWKK